MGVLADVAALAQVLAETRADVLTTQPDSTGVRTARTHAAALAVEAREVACLAGNPGQPVGQDLVAPRPGTGIVTVSGVGDLPAAVAHLTALIDSRACPVNDLLSISRVIALTSRACADALVTARTASPPDQRFNLGVVAVALAGHATFLARAVTRERADLIGPSGPTGRLLAQASEIGACALPRVQDLRRRPETARGHTPTILAYAAHAPTLTRAIRGAVRHAAIHGQIAIHDRSGEDHTFWRSATLTDLTPLSEDLALAIRAGSARPEVLTAAVTAARADTAAQRPGGDLAAALEGRLAQYRSARPSATAQRIRSASRPAPAPPAAVSR